MKCTLIVAVALMLKLANASIITAAHITTKGFVPQKGRVVGGSIAEEGLAPYQVSLQYMREHFCGGSIISTLWILSAAHCLVNKRPSDIMVFTGAQDLTDSAGVIYYVKRFYVHCNYNNPESCNDISLVLLKEPIVLNSRTQIISLPTQPMKDGAEVLLTGWGTEEYKGNVPEQLKMVFLEYLGYEECKRAHKNTSRVDVGHVCTLTRNGEGACHGDSGGPLVCNGVLVGVVNWGEPCAIGYPDVFASVHFYLDWIRTIMSGNDRCTFHSYIKDYL